jgi:hypothetical protein
LKIDDAGVGKVNVASPTRHNRVGLNSSMPIFFEEIQEGFAHLRQSEAFFGRGITNKGVEPAFVAASFPTGLHRNVLGPEVFATFWAEFSHEAFLFEERKLVSFSWETFGHSIAPIAVGLWNSPI